MKEKAKTGILLFLYAVVGAMSYRLYLRQALNYPGKLGNYVSDLPEHIKDGTGGLVYSLMERSYGFLLQVLNLNEKSIGIFLALLTIGTIWMTYRLLKWMMPSSHSFVLHLLAFVCMFVMPLHIRQIVPLRYLGLQSGSIWHNSTYTGMKFAAMCVLLFYFPCQERYQKKYSAADFIVFTLLLIFVNFMKPNFLLCFAPAMAVMLLVDCIASRGKTLKQQILFGIPVLISLAVIVYETMVLFTGERGDSSITFALAYNLRLRTSHPVASLAMSAAFPLVVLSGNLRELKKDRIFRMSWLVWLFGLLEYLFLCETGPRKDHGNFSWGYSYCLYLVFVMCAGMLYRNIIEYFTSEKKSVGRGGFLVISTGLLLWHLICGVQFFWILFQGGTYFG